MVIIKKMQCKKAPDLYEFFDNINYDIFNGELDLPILGVSFIPDVDAFYMIKNGTSYIALSLGCTFEQGIQSLIHEMIHQWQKQNDKFLSHDKEFIRICRKAEKFYSFPRRSIEGVNNDQEFDDNFNPVIL